MGGFGSGRKGGWPTLESTGSYLLDIGCLTRAGLCRGAVTNGRIDWQNDDFELYCRVDTKNHPFGVVLFHASRTDPPEHQSYRVGLLTSSPPYGGTRWWFRCPQTHRRCTKLCLPLGGHQFWSRQAYQLGYQCQRESRPDRLMRRARKLHRALGGDGLALGQSPPAKPSGMWQRTFERMLEEWKLANERAEGAWCAGALRFLSRYGRL